MTSVKKAIKIFARLKPSESTACQYELDKHINDDGSTDDILVVNSSNALNLLNNNLPEEYPSNASMNRPDSYKFRFSKVFDQDSTQDELFTEICQPVLESALQGYNSTIFAYGQTGSGKTYTMTGSRQQWKNRGIIPRSLSYIFEKFNDLTDRGYIASAFLSYLEIYNENGYDLLHSGFSSGRIEDLKKVQLLEDAQQQIHMKNLTVHPIKSEDEAMQLLYLGDHNRIIAETPMNEASTRSHCIFTIHLNIREGVSSTVRRSKVHLVDLAGSERLSNSTSTGQLFHEARHINLALHYLEQVIVALGEAHRSHIPYRNSMMTSILRDSLGGNCMTSMVATLSLDQRNIMETLSTCRFSQRVALVTNAAILNEETDPMLLIAQLKTENRRLKDIITNSQIKTLESCTSPLSQEEVADCWRLVEKYIADPDDEAILPVAPDMRMVQTCFRCLKMAVQMNKDDLVGISPAMAMVTLGGSSSPFSESARKYDVVMSKEQLVECLRIRDAEIDVLKNMLKPSASLSRKKNSPFRHSSSGAGRAASSQFEYGDGPNPQSARLLSGILEDDGNFYPSVGSDYQKMSIDHPLLNESEDAGHTEYGAPDTSLMDFIGSTQKADQSSPADHELIPENLLIEGFSEPKRQALDSFKRSYKGADKLINLKKTLSAKRSEVDSIETLLRRNHANLKNLKVVLMSSEGGAEEEDLFMKEAVQSQTQSIQKQERQLMKTKDEQKQLEENIKGLYSQFFTEFEKQWVSMQEFRERSGIPSEIDLFVGADEPPTSEVSAGASSKSGKPFSDVTKGIIKGVGGLPQISPRQHNQKKSPRSGNNSFHNHFYIAPVPLPPAKLPQGAHISRSFNAQSSKDEATLISARRSISSARGKQAPTNSPRTDNIKSSRSPKSNPVPYYQPATFQYSKPKRTHPPPSPSAPMQASASMCAPSVQLIHHHHHPEFPSEVSTDNFAGYYKQPPQNVERNRPVVDYEKDDAELIKELPMTGDASVDQEILSFFTRRQAIFRQINSDKNISKSQSGASTPSEWDNNSRGYNNASQQRYDERNNHLDFAPSF